MKDTYLFICCLIVFFRNCSSHLSVHLPVDVFLSILFRLLILVYFLFFLHYVRLLLVLFLVNKDNYTRYGPIAAKPKPNNVVINPQFNVAE